MLKINIDLKLNKRKHIRKDIMQQYFHENLKRNTQK